MVRGTQLVITNVIIVLTKHQSANQGREERIKAFLKFTGFILLQYKSSAEFSRTF